MENTRKTSEEAFHASDSSQRDDQSEESLKSSLDNKSDINFEDFQDDIQSFEDCESSIVPVIEAFEGFLVSLKDLIKNSKHLGKRLSNFYGQEGRLATLVPIISKVMEQVIPPIEKEVSNMEKAFDASRQEYNSISKQFKERFLVRKAVEQQFNSVSQVYQKALKKNIMQVHNKKKEAYQRMKKLHDSFQGTFSKDLSIYVVQKTDPFDKTFQAFVNFHLTVSRCVSETRTIDESTDMASQCEYLMNSSYQRMPKIKELKHVLDNKICLQFFKSFLKSQHADENLNFWIETQKYGKLKDKEEMKVLAKDIYKKYMKGSSETEVNLSSGVKNSISHNLEKSDFQPDPSLFKGVSKEVYNLMQTELFDRFISSEHFSRLKKRYKRRDFTTFRRPTELEELLAETKKIKVKDQDVPQSDNTWVFTHALNEISSDTNARRELYAKRSKSYGQLRDAYNDSSSPSASPPNIRPPSPSKPSFLTKFSRSPSTIFKPNEVRGLAQPQTRVERANTDTEVQNQVTIKSLERTNITRSVASSSNVEAPKKEKPQKKFTLKNLLKRNKDKSKEKNKDTAVVNSNPPMTATPQESKSPILKSSEPKSDTSATQPESPKQKKKEEILSVKEKEDMFTLRRNTIADVVKPDILKPINKKKEVRSTSIVRSAESTEQEAANTSDSADSDSTEKDAPLLPIDNRQQKYLVESIVPTSPEGDKKEEKKEPKKISKDNNDGKMRESYSRIMEEQKKIDDELKLKAQQREERRKQREEERRKEEEEEKKRRDKEKERRLQITQEQQKELEEVQQRVEAVTKRLQKANTPSPST